MKEEKKPSTGEVNVIEAFEKHFLTNLSKENYNHLEELKIKILFYDSIGDYYTNILKNDADAGK